MSTIEKLFTIVNNLKVGKGKLSITKKKNYQKSRPKRGLNFVSVFFWN